jgi:hypothetical protein
MTRYQYEEPVSPDFSHPWIERRLEQLEGHFHDFLTSREGRLYVLFGGCRAGKTSLLEIIRHRPPRKSEGKSLPVFIDLAEKGVLSSSEKFFELLFKEIRRQLGICYIDPKKVARFFKDSGAALPDFKEAFNDIVRSPESKIGGARLLLLLDSADELTQVPFASDLFANLVQLFSSAPYKPVIHQLDIVVTGGAPLYNQLLGTQFARRKLKHWYNIEVLPDDAVQALITELPAVQNQPDLIKDILRYTGGQPYLLQYFMAQLEALTSRGQPVTSKAVEQLVLACLQPRSKPDYWFHDCLKAIKEQGAYPVYAPWTRFCSMASSGKLTIPAATSLPANSSKSGL